MKLTLLATTLFSAVLAAPHATLSGRQTTNGTVSNVDVGPAPPLPPSTNLDIITTSDISGDPVAKRELTKRSIVIDVYYDINRGGRHEGLTTDINRCYNLYNGWNDQISSLGVPAGTGCYFYQDGDCNGKWLQTPKSSVGIFVNTPAYGFNDNISSYRCYQ